LKGGRGKKRSTETKEITSRGEYCKERRLGGAVKLAGKVSIGGRALPKEEEQDLVLFVG